MRGVSNLRTTVTGSALGAVSGLLSGFTALAVAEAVASLVRPRTGPVTVVGGAAIDRTPAPVKDFAIRTFGEDDKLVLQLGILAALGVLGVGLGLLALRNRRPASAGVLLFGLVGAAAALSRPDARGPPTPCRRWPERWRARWRFTSWPGRPPGPTHRPVAGPTRSPAHGPTEHSAAAGPGGGS